MMQNKIFRISGMVASLIGICLLIFGNIRTASNFRIIGDIVQNVLIFHFILLLFWPEEDKLENALFVGLFTMGLDFALETVAVWLNWWYPKGGFQWPPILIIPLEMVVSFMIIGTTTGILLYFPEKIRELDFKPLNWLKIFVKNPKFDLFWRILQIFVTAVIGTNGDFSAGWEIWMPGPGWHWIYTFFVWFGGGLLILAFFLFVEKKRKKINSNY